MESEEKIIIAFLFKRSGKTMLKDSELYLPLALELGWFSTQKAQQFVKSIQKKELVIPHEGKLTPSFDINQVEIPTGFFPSKPAPAEKKTTTYEPILDVLIQYIAHETQQESQHIKILVDDLAHKKKIIPEVAAALLAKKHNLSIEKYIPSIEKKLF